MINVELSYESVDAVMVAGLKDTINSLHSSIAELKAMDKLLPFQQGDLEDHYVNLVSAKIMYEYYGGNL